MAEPELQPSASGREVPAGAVASPRADEASISAEVAAAIDRISASTHFLKSRVLKDLLAYLWQRRDGEISEYHIGIEVLGRRPDFDPKLDATVRVNIARLRQKLDRYYESEGKDDPLRLTIPAGVYRIVCAKKAAAADSPPVPVAEPLPPAVPATSSRWRYAAFALAVACVLIAVHDFVAWNRLQHSTTALHPFWTEALRCRPGYGIVVPSPQFFRWRQQGFVARDFKVNAHEEIQNSPVLKLLRERWGEPETTHLYTVTTDTLASGEIARYLQDRGVAVDILDKSNVSQSLLEERDSILMFAAANAAQYEPFMRPLSFRFVDGQLRNLKPGSGEPQMWTGKTYAQDHSVSYGIFASLPGRTGTTRQLLLASNFNHALATFLTSRPLLQNALEYWNANGSPEFFEMVMRLEVKGMTTLEARPEAFHAWRGSVPFVSAK